MNKDLLNEMWLFIVMNKPTSESVLKELKFVKKDSMLLYLIEHNFVSLDENGVLSAPTQMDVDTLTTAVVIGLNMNSIEQYVVISKEDKNKVMQALLAKNFDRKKDPFEKVKNDKWVFLLNDVNTLIKKYKGDAEFELELDVVKRLRKVLETKIKNGER